MDHGKNFFLLPPAFLGGGVAGGLLTPAKAGGNEKEVEADVDLQQQTTLSTSSFSLAH